MWVQKRNRCATKPHCLGERRICPSANGHIQAISRDAKGRKQYRYHARYREIRDENKFGRMLAFGAALPKIRVQANKDLSLPGSPQRKVVAAIVRLLDETCIRVGNEEYAKANNSFELTTLRDRHADIRGQSLRFHFRGRSNQEQDITLRDRRLARIVKRFQDLPGQELELGPASSEAETNRNIVQAVKETARHLGNRPAACRKYYIHPAVFDSYVEQTIFAVMRKAPTNKPTPVGRLRTLDIAVLRIVKSHMAAKRAKSVDLRGLSGRKK